MKWYIGYIFSIITAIAGFAILAILSQDAENPDEIINAYSLLGVAFASGFIGGFIAPYHVLRTAKYTAATYILIACIPLAAVLFALDDVQDQEINALVAILVIIILVVFAIAIIIAIVVGTIMLFVGGAVGSLFGKQVFSIDMYDDPKLKYG